LSSALLQAYRDPSYALSLILAPTPLGLLELLLTMGMYPFSELTSGSSAERGLGAWCCRPSP